jgi:uncharacterized protein (DUF1499 family)
LRIIRRMLAGIAIAVLIVAALGLGLRLYMGRAAEDKLRPGEDVAIADLRGPLPQNGFFACQAGYCGVEPGMVSPVFAIDADRLRQLWTEMLRGEDGIVTVRAEPERRRLVLVQHSAGLRFPDVITVEFVALDPDRSSVALYSRARYGKLDFGVNRRRVETWLARLQQLASAAPPR